MSGLRQHALAIYSALLVGTLAGALLWGMATTEQPAEAPRPCPPELQREGFYDCSDAPTPVPGVPDTPGPAGPAFE